MSQEGGPGEDPGHTGETVPRLAWECPEVPPDELKEVSGEKEVWASLLSSGQVRAVRLEHGFAMITYSYIVSSADISNQTYLRILDVINVLLIIIIIRGMPLLV